MYGYEKIELAVRQLEDWAACVMGVVAAEGGDDVTGLGRSGDRLQWNDGVLAFGAVDKLSRIVMCCAIRVLVARWREDVLAAATDVTWRCHCHVGTFSIARAYYLGY